MTPGSHALRLGAGVVLALGGLLGGCSTDGGTAVDLTPTGPPTSSAVDGAPGPDVAAQLTTSDAAAATAAAGAPEPESSAEASVGGVVAGFPSDLVPTYPGAEVLLTSAAASTAAEGQLEVTLAGRTPDPPEDVVAFYRAALTDAGFTESPATGGGEVLAATFTRAGGPGGRGTEVLAVVVTAADQGDGQRFTVGGTTAAPAR